MKDLYTENYKTLLNETEDTDRKISCVRGLRDLILLKCPTLPKAIYKFNGIHTVISMVFFFPVQSFFHFQFFFAKIEKEVPKTHIDSQRTLNDQNNLEKENIAGGLILPHFKTYYKTTVIKRAWSLHADIHTEQWDRIGDPAMNPCVHGPAVLDTGAKDDASAKGQHLQQTVLQRPVFTSEIMELDLYLIPYSKINSKWVSNLNVRPETIKIPNIKHRGGAS